jgi:hypothetical protein
MRLKPLQAANTLKSFILVQIAVLPRRGTLEFPAESGYSKYPRQSTG